MRTSPGDIGVHTPACLPTGLRENTHFCAESGAKSGFFLPPVHGGRSRSQRCCCRCCCPRAPGSHVTRRRRVHGPPATCREKQERSCMDAHVLFSFDNPLVNVVGRPKVGAYAKAERPLAQQHEQRYVTVLSPSRSGETNKRIEG